MTNKGLTYRDRLTDDQVRQIRSLHAQGMSDYDIARKVDRHRAIVNRVTRRQSYRHVLDVEGSTETCPCLKHTEARLQQINLNNARAAAAKVICLACQRRSTAAAGDVQAADGRFICDPCRRKS